MGPWGWVRQIPGSRGEFVSRGGLARVKGIVRRLKHPGVGLRRIGGPGWGGATVCLSVAFHTDQRLTEGSRTRNEHTRLSVDRPESCQGPDCPRKRLDFLRGVGRAGADNTCQVNDLRHTCLSASAPVSVLRIASHPAYLREPIPAPIPEWRQPLGSSPTYACVSPCMGCPALSIHLRLFPARKRVSI